MKYKVKGLSIYLENKVKFIPGLSVSELFRVVVFDDRNSRFGRIDILFPNVFLIKQLAIILSK